jgi:hypothetical protein
MPPKTAEPPPAEDDAPPPMEKDVHIVVQVIVRKCEPLPEEAPRPRTGGSGDESGEEGGGEDAGGGEGGGEEAAPEPKPTLEELDVKFVLNTFNGSTSERSPARRRVPSPVPVLCFVPTPLPGCCEAARG